VLPGQSRRPFKQYVAWLRGQDQAEATAYWSKLIADFDSPNQLPFDTRPGAVPSSGQPPKELRLELSESATEALLGVPIYPGAQFITSYDAGRGQRLRNYCAGIDR